MRRVNHGYYVSYLLTVAVFVAGAFTLSHSFWGLNHLTFLPVWFVISSGGFLVTMFITSLLIGNAPKTDEAIKNVSSFLWDSQHWHILLVVILLSGVFYVFSLKTFFLGDGYTLLSVFGQGGAYLHKWTVPLSSYLVRGVQGLIGEYTFESAKTSFQLLSILSGFICTYNLICIAGLLTTEPAKRFIGIATFVCSGSLLLFLGYVEFYPFVWAIVTTFFHFAIRSLKGQLGLIWAFAAFLVALAVHVQAAMLLGGAIALLPIRTISGKKFALTPRVMAIAALLLVALGVVISFMKDYLGVKNYVLAITAQELDSINYTVLSWLHLSDIVNQLLIVFPGFLILLFLGNAKFKSDSVTVFLFSSAIGGFLWLFFIDPGLGMARDWDLFSVAVLPVGLLLFYRICDKDVKISNSQSLSYIVLCLAITVSFLAVNLIPSSSENRFHDLLRRYESKDYTGWSMLSYYYYNLGENEKSMAIAKEMATYFPIRGRIIDAQNELDRKNPNKAIEIGLALLQQEPNNREILHLLAKAYKLNNNFEFSEKYYIETLKVHRHSRIANELGQLYLEHGQYDKAIDVFRGIHKVDPSLTNVLEGLGLAYFRKGEYGATLSIADSLFMRDGKSPGAHLLKMVVAIASGSTDEAKLHFNEYLRNGKGRSDYQSIRDYYGYLNNP